MLTSIIVNQYLLRTNRLFVTWNSVHKLVFVQIQIQILISYGHNHRQIDTDKNTTHTHKSRLFIYP